MAEELEQFADELEGSKDFQADLAALIRRVLTEHQRIIFNGNGYTEDWIAEAEKRGLCNFPSTAEALPAYIAQKNVDLFVKHGIYTPDEVQARYEIHAENYAAVTSIEAKTMADMIRRQILPAVSAFGAELCERMWKKQQMAVSCGYETETAKAVSALTEELYAACGQLEADIAGIPADATEAMGYCHKNLVPGMAKARKAADELEALLPKEAWPFPVYGDILFY